MAEAEKSILEETRLETTYGTVLKKTTDELLAQAMVKGGRITLDQLEGTIIAEMLKKSKENGQSTVVSATQKSTS